jgi:hypothetical protein
MQTQADLQENAHRRQEYREHEAHKVHSLSFISAKSSQTRASSVPARVCAGLLGNTGPSPGTAYTRRLGRPSISSTRNATAGWSAGLTRVFRLCRNSKTAKTPSPQTGRPAPIRVRNYCVPRCAHNDERRDLF